MPTEGRKVTSVSFDKTLWTNFRAEVKHRHEEIQNVFDRLMRDYISPKGENTNAAKSVTVEGEVWRPRTPRLNADNIEREEEEDNDESSDEEENEEDEDGFTVVPHLPGSNLLEVDDESEGEDEESDEEEDVDESEEEW